VPARLAERRDVSQHHDVTKPSQGGWQDCAKVICRYVPERLELRKPLFQTLLKTAEFLDQPPVIQHDV
jgi:hypothetical protein